MIAPHIPYLAKKRVVLASASPRRSEILNLLGLTCVVEPSRFDERTLRDQKFESPTQYVAASARSKAGEVAGRVDCDLLIAADTVVVLDDQILEKPASDDEAKRFLRRLSDRHHTVLTGVCLYAGEVVVQFVEQTKVKFAALPDSVIEAYVRSGEPLDKAGAYGIQGIGGSLVTGIDGCYFNVMGLPMHRVALEIARLVDDGKL